MGGMVNWTERRRIVAAMSLLGAVLSILAIPRRPTPLNP